MKTALLMRNVMHIKPLAPTLWITEFQFDNIRSVANYTRFIMHSPTWQAAVQMQGFYISFNIKYG